MCVCIHTCVYIYIYIYIYIHIYGGLPSHYPKHDDHGVPSFFCPRSREQLRKLLSVGP